MRSCLLLAALLASSAHAADWIMECPRQLATSQSLAGEIPPGWSGVARTAAAMSETKPGAATTEATPPVAISVFDGAPSPASELSPDNPNARVIQWTLKQPRKGDVTIVCNYADTRLGLARKAPPDATSCALSVTAPAVICK